MRAAPSDRPAPLRCLKQRLLRQALPLAGDPSRVPADGAPGAIDVIVPVYGAAAELGRCLRSLAAHTDLARHRLVLVLDGPQPGAVEAALAAAALPVEVLRQPERRGFVDAVNLGMAASDRDVVLLNSDTRVTAGWLAKLQHAAYSAPEIATVTPFSNSATICSLPRFLESNALPAGWDVDSFGRLVEERAGAVYPRLPTGVGVCLYIKRKALAALGPFDRESFGLGYGEESEFCMRALKAGYAHALDDATFIFHEGHRSFGASRAGRVAAAHRRLSRLHPEYIETVSRFVREDPLRPLRERVINGLAPARSAADGDRAGTAAGDRTDTAAGGGRAGAGGRAGRSGGARGQDEPRRVLHIVHGWPPWNHAGTELYAAWLARRQAA
jgi:GT2 family glycosyltransferase